MAAGARGWDAGWTDGDGESVSVTSARLRGLSVVMVMRCGNTGKILRRMRHGGTSTNR